MPVSNARAEALMNGVNGPLSNAAGVVLQPLVGLTQYLDDDTALFQGYVTTPKGTKTALQTMVIATGVVTTLPSTPGASQLVAADGVWAAFYGGYYYDSYGKGGVKWYPLAVDKGKILVSPGYGLGLAWWDSKTLTPLSSAQVDPLEGSASGGVVVAPIGKVLQTFPPQGWPAFTQIINFTFSDGWLVGWHQALNGLILWEAGSSPLGYIVAQHVNDFGATLTVLPNGTIHVFASSGSGQLPGELLTYVVDPRLHTVNGKVVTLVNLLDPPQSHAVPTFPSAPIACVPFDWFEEDPSAPRIVGPGESTEGDIRYVFQDVKTEPLAPALLFAAKVHARVLGYCDDSPCDPHSVDPRAHDIGIQCYLKGKRSDGSYQGLAEAQVRIQASIDNVRKTGRSFALVVPVYTGSDEWDLDDVLALLLWDWNKAVEYGVHVLPFGIDRGPHHPELTTALTRMLVAATGHTTPPTQPTDPPSETDPDMKDPILLPEGSPELDQFRKSEGAAYDAVYGPLLGATNGYGECGEVNSLLRQHHKMDGDRGMLQPLMIENALRKRDKPPTNNQMEASVAAAVAAWRRLRGY